MDHVREDADRPSELVTIGSRWFGWRHHWTVMEERTGRFGLREVRFVRDDKPGVPSTDKRVRDHWLPAWRVQRFCDRTEEVEVPERERTRSKRLALMVEKPVRKTRPKRKAKSKSSTKRKTTRGRKATA